MDDSSSRIPPISQPSVSSGSRSGNFSQQDLAITESVCTEWTNEKHSLYLKSMEASFVDQLYDSMDLLDLKFPKGKPDQNASTSSSQFKVLRGGCWKRINFQRAERQVNVKNESHEILTNPWVQHFKSSRTSQLSPQETNASQCRPTDNSSEKKTDSCGRTTSSKHFYPCHHDLIGCNTEVSDQNFVDEDIQTEKKSSICSSKRCRANGSTSNGKITRRSA